MSRPIALTLAVDNNADEGLIAEHGLAIWIETESSRILLDTGAGGALSSNAERLGIDLRTTTGLVLSHGHYDHTGGLPAFLDLNGTADVFHCPDVETRRFSLHPGKPPRSIGMPEEARRAFSALPAARRHETTAPRLIAPGIGLTGPIPRPHAFEDTGGPFFLDPEGSRVDTIPDDQAMWIETETGLVIVLGCCHAGLTNTVDHIRKASGENRVRGIVGGTHLVNADASRLERTLDAARSWDLEFLVPCHCTGATATAALGTALGDVVRPGRAGTRLKLNLRA